MSIDIRKPLWINGGKKGDILRCVLVHGSSNQFPYELACPTWPKGVTAFVNDEGDGYYLDGSIRSDITVENIPPQYCWRCEAVHDVDPRNCAWVRAIEFRKDGTVKSIAYHGIEGITATITEARQEVVDGARPKRERCRL